MIKKVLIANRGEIALRIVRACNELGIKTLAVYSEADEQSLHVQLADEAICIGAAPSNQSYLKADRIIAAAEIANVDAIHPGYGFLAENADFAEQCARCKIKFIGPKAEAIINFGDKAKAREMAVKAKVPVIPGSAGVIDDEKEALATAKKIGFPVIIKAVAGGGGKGMRTAHNAVAFAKEYANARSEAEKAFGNGAVYLERFLDAPRHIEIQILGDQFGNIIHLGERDCSVQRRHQKIIEEAPSPFISNDLRKKMGRDAVKLAKSVNYEGAGTVEFLVDKKGEYFFIEMNTRIQVEHGVTEEVTGVDLVKEQLLIASGKKLSYSQRDIKITKHCIECRVCAEDPGNNFAPCPGNITLYYSPGGHGVRIDSHVYSGYSIPPHYDSMIAKVMAFGKTRELALDRMDRALGEYLIRGIKTNIPFARAIIRDPVFREGKATTKYIEEFIKKECPRIFTPEQPSHTVHTMKKESDQNKESKIPTISEDSNTLGEIHINHSVVASIVRLAALEVPGVAEVCSGSGFVDGITEIFSKKSDERGIQIDKDEVGDYKIRIRVILYFGVELAATGNEIQQRIVNQVEKMTSKSVASVDVIIDEVKTPEEDKNKSKWDSHEALD